MSTGDPWCPIHGQILCTCRPAIHLGGVPVFVTSGVLPFGADGVIIRLPLTDFADRVYRDPDLSTLPIVRDERLYEDGNPPEKPDGSPVAKVEQARAAYLRGEGRRWQRIGGQLHDLERGPDGLLVRR